MHTGLEPGQKLAGQGPFGVAQDPDVVPCACCQQLVQHVDKMMVEKEIIHKACFKCALCDTRLQMGYAVLELALYNRYGPCWYCTLICAHQPLAKKEEALKKKGIQVRQPKGKKPHEFEDKEKARREAEAEAQREAEERARAEADEAARRAQKEAEAAARATEEDNRPKCLLNVFSANKK